MRQTPTPFETPLYKKNQEESGARWPSTPASQLCSLETIRPGYKINKAAMDVEEEQIDVVVKIKQKHGKKEKIAKTSVVKVKLVFIV